MRLPKTIWTTTKKYLHHRFITEKILTKNTFTSILRRQFLLQRKYNSYFNHEYSFYFNLWIQYNELQMKFSITNLLIFKCSCTKNLIYKCNFKYKYNFSYGTNSRPITNTNWDKHNVKFGYKQNLKIRSITNKITIVSKIIEYKSDFNHKQILHRHKLGVILDWFLHYIHTVKVQLKLEIK